MNYTHGGLPESEAWTWMPENQRKLGQIVADLENKEKAGKARNAYYELKRHFMVDTWTKFIVDLTDFRKQNGFRGLNEMLADASPINTQKGEGMTMSEAALKRIAGGFAEISEGILMLAGSEAGGPALMAQGKAGGSKAPKAEKPAEPAVDFAKLRQECKEIILDQVKVKGKDKIVAILGEFKAAKLPEVKDEQLANLKAALDKEKAVEPEAVA